MDTPGFWEGVTPSIRSIMVGIMEKNTYNFMYTFFIFKEKEGFDSAQILIVIPCSLRFHLVNVIASEGNCNFKSR